MFKHIAIYYTVVIPQAMLPVNNLCKFSTTVGESSSKNIILDNVYSFV